MTDFKAIKRRIVHDVQRLAVDPVGRKLPMGSELLTVRVDLD
jgi:hypothetical protein